MSLVRRKLRSGVLEEAHRLYDLGYDIHWISAAVVGDRKSGKAPVGRWERRERYAWSRLEETYRGTFNLGFQPGITSQVDGRDLIVIDFDFQDVSQEGAGRSALRGLFGRDVTPTVITGSGMGEHYHVRIPRGVRVGSTVLWGSGHTEIRVISSGGNAVLPPSTHWSGESYTWADGGVIDATNTLVEALTAIDQGTVDTSFELGTVIDLRVLKRATELRDIIVKGVAEGDRSEKLYWVILELWKRGHSREDILATLLCDKYGIGEKYREAGRRSITRARADIARVVEKAERKDAEEKDHLVGLIEEFHAKYAHVIYGDSARVAYKGDDGEVRFLREGAFISTYATEGYTSQGGVRVEPAKIWLTHPKRPTYRSIIFHPGEPAYRENSEGALNLWQGFATTGAEGGGSCELFRDHLLRNISGGDAGMYQWLWNWLAHLVQRPWEKPGTAVVLQGPTGTGKTMVSDVICRLVGGAHAMSTSNPDLLAGKFNRILGNKIFVAGEEVSWGGDARGNAILRDRVTAETMQLEPKGVDAITVGSFHRFMLITNESWPVNMLPQERRYSLYVVGRENQKDQEFFGALLKQMGDGGYERLMWELRGATVSDAMIRSPPVSDAMREQQERSLGGAARWIYDSLVRGWFYRDGEGSPGWRVRVDPERMVMACKGGLGRRGDYVTGAELRAELRTCLGVEIPVIRLSGTTRRGWQLPKTLSVARSMFDDVMGTSGGWND